jgi:DNA topoisomerase-1
LPKGLDPNLIDLETALKLLGLPREVGKHPESGEMITAGIGRFGAYIKMGSLYKTLADGDDVLNIGLNRAVVLIAEPSKGGNRPARVPGKALGDHPEDGKPVTLNSGRFGPYVKWGKVMATVTKSYDPETLTLAEATEILAAKIAKGPSTFGKKGKAAKATKEEKVEKTEKVAPAKAAKPKKAKAAS